MKVFFLALALVSVLAGCGSGETEVTGADQDAVFVFSESKTDNLLAGMNANDYAMFSKDFDEEMLNAMPQSAFDKLKADRDAKLGRYISRKVNGIIRSGDFYSVIYEAVFEKEDAVVVRVVFRVDEPHEISGLWFNK